jgi:hypothetical protein
MEDLDPGLDRVDTIRASALVRQLEERNPGLVILPAHDPGAAERLRFANA